MGGGLSLMGSDAKTVAAEASSIVHINWDAFHSKYEVDLSIQLGKGAQGEVYKCASAEVSKRAHQQQSRRHIRVRSKACWAVKIVDKRELSDGALALLAKEVQIHGAVTQTPHSGIVSLHECIHSPKADYIVMDLMSGGELFPRLAKTVSLYTEARVAEYTKQLCGAMAYIHMQGVVHRDLKPQNLLCSTASEDTGLKICDFGLAEWLPEGKYIEDRVVRGTPEFISKEIIRKQPYGHLSDVWSAGVIVFVLLCGRLPFDDPKRAENIRRDANYQPLFEVIAKGEVHFEPRDDQLSERAKDFLTQLLSRRDQRPSFAQALEHPWLCGEAPTNVLEHVPAGIQEFMATVECRKHRGPARPDRPVSVATPPGAHLP